MWSCFKRNKDKGENVPLQYAFVESYKNQLKDLESKIKAHSDGESKESPETINSYQQKIARLKRELEQLAEYDFEVLPDQAPDVPKLKS